ncbi:hypothetical protein NQ315_005627 [Exocentrus adspersus]|uniref:Uncharacterized protein n=1 Tax=Exocentrus adspersus TaxID=1586481 RepID=A0AAV8V8U1_9CUCU|nr:hypothetical protein NQ315_005627 [Exocentrus adspersus]
MNSDNFKYVKTHFYRRVTEITNGCAKTTKSFSRSPKFQQKGIIFVWPQRRKVYHSEEMTFITWLLAHTLFWLNNMYLLPCGAAVPLKQPPWEYKPPIRKPENRDYIIEPDWDCK